MANVTIQPPVADAYVISENPDANYGTGTGLYIGESNTGVDYVRKAVMKFDLTSIPSTAIITLAQLGIYYYDKDAGTDWSNTPTIYRLTSAFGETTVTWDTFPTNDSINIGSTTINQSTSYGWITITLSNVKFQELINGTMTNYGFLLYDTSEVANNCIIVYSREYATTTLRPKLYIEYTLPGMSSVAVSPFFNFFKTFENPWMEQGGLWQPNKKGLVTI